MISFQLAKSLRSEGNLEYEGIIKTTHKHMNMHWVNTVRTRKGFDEAQKESIETQKKNLEAQKENYEKTERIRQDLLKV